MRQEMMGFWDTVASAGPYTNNLHLTSTITNNVKKTEGNCTTAWHSNCIIAVKERKVQSFTAHDLLLMAKSAFKLEDHARVHHNGVAPLY